ncbi:HlyU family transcriptional regulator [Pseudotabrizicola sp.]|uniref:HlyU family transcriptional regulator n=1 Tax=Pseudotabrizicola sp. TaxID=2939647 RepID=UPI00271C683C|nr:HlyU family transcriptional regulator [Pseudotabrizicola sp.]MDO8883072.1 HlyU family transcriptional regulator [Pseudotabrizicola sp.]
MPSFLSRLFGKTESSPPAKGVEPVLHNDFRIIPAPIREGSVFRIAARVEKTIDGTVKTHQLIRADTRNSLEEAAEASVAKAKQAIDQLGDTLFS